MNSPAPATSRGAWMALIAALLGWMFDGAEMGVFTLVGRHAVKDMLGLGAQTSPEQETQVGLYFGIIIAVFLVGAATGGVLFGWLGDRIGRVRAMSLSVLTYALFTGLCGFTQTPMQLGILRFIASLGMGGEWALGVALVMEVWPNKSRAFMAGLIGAAANVGYLLVGVIGIGLAAFLTQAKALLLGVGVGESTAAMLTAHQGWRLIMILGTLPALLTFFFRIFVPESAKWEEEHAKGHTSNWASYDLLGVIVGAAGPALIVFVWANSASLLWMRIGGTLLGLTIAIFGYTYPVSQYLVRALADDQNNALGSAPQMSREMIIRRMLLAACLSGVALLGTWSSMQWAPAWATKLVEGKNIPSAAGLTLIFASLGAIVGTILAALAGDWLGRRWTYCIMCLTSIASAQAFYQFHSEFGTSFLFFTFLGGMCTASFYGWLPLYLPELFPTKVRATGQGFGFNFGRILAAIGTLQMSALLPLFKDVKTYAGLQGGYPAALSFISLIYLVGVAIIWLAPETKGKPLPE